MKYAIQLSTTGSFYDMGCAVPSLDQAKLFDDYREADEVRRGCNDLWVRRGIIVRVHVAVAREVRRVVED